MAFFPSKNHFLRPLAAPLSSYRPLPISEREAELPNRTLGDPFMLRPHWVEEGESHEKKVVQGFRATFGQGVKTSKSCKHHK